MERLRHLVHRLTTPVDELDRERLAEFCAGLPVTPIEGIQPRCWVRVAGEVTYVRTVRRGGDAPIFEATVADGRGGRVLAAFLGRDRVPGITPGRRLIVAGVAAPEGRDWRLTNPEYELLPSPVAER